jgi:muramidase (phage lysozyme)
MPTLDQLRDALNLRNVQAFLRVIRAGESHETNDEAYAALYGWRPGNGRTFADFTDHPRQAFQSPWGWTSAAGAYQAMCAVPGKVKTDTWGDFARWCASSDYRPMFGQSDQDLFAVWCIHRRGALDDVIAGRVEAAIAKCQPEWASLPGSKYGQPKLSMARALEVWRRWAGGDAAAPADPPAAPLESPRAAQPASERPASAQPDPEQPIPAGEAPGWTPGGRTMPAIAPIIAAVLPSIVDAVPKLGRLFGSGSEVSERNIKAAEMVVEAVKSATGAVNEQAAAERVRTDPSAAQAAARAIDSIWYELTEAGGGGIDGARRADAEMRRAGDLLHSASFWVALLLLPLVYLLVLSLIGLIGTATWSDDVRAGLAGSLISAIVGGLVGYYYGTSTSRNRAPAASA